MVRDASSAAPLCGSTRRRALLRSSARPIVLLPARPGHGLAGNVADGVPQLGVMLPYTAIHHVLAEAFARPLVVTSANHGDAPIPIDERDGLPESIDVVVTHPRRITAHADDSVVQLVDGPPMILRRARGYVPAPLRLPRPLRAPVLAVGGHKKAAAAIGVDDLAVLGPHVGDLDRPATRERWIAGITHLERLLDASITAICCDLHPDYAATGWARTQSRARGIPLFPVQHHHAHFAAVLAEHGVGGPAIGVCFDGVGLGSDRGLWGGELLVGDCAAVRRAGHLGLVAQPGGDAAARAPWRMAVAHLVAAGCEPHVVADRVGAEQVARLRAVIDKGVHAPQTSSAGRLFDALAGVLGCADASFEGAPAMWLQALATADDDVQAYEWHVRVGDPGSIVIDHAPMWRRVLADLAAAVPASAIAGRFHRGLALAIACACVELRASVATDVVALGGGVFQNALLVALCRAALRARGFTTLHGEEVPPNDGGLAYGQLAVVAARVDELSA